MIPQQRRGMAVRALVHLIGGFHYWTPVLDGLCFPADRPKVNLYYADKLPHPFWVRDGHEQNVSITLPDNANQARSAVLWVRIRDGGEGTEQQPFTLNGTQFQSQARRRSMMSFLPGSPLNLIYCVRGLMKL